MSVESTVINALSSLCSVVVPNVYTGTAKEYIVFNYDSTGAEHAEGKPVAMRELLQVHWYCETGKNPRTMKKSVCEALFAAGCTYPSITNASDGDGQHYVFECETWSAV